MKKIKIIIIILSLSFIMTNVNAKEINVFMAYSETCGYCKSANEFFDEYVKENKNVIVHKYSVYDEENDEVLEKIEDTLNKSLSSIPLIIIGEKYLTGFNDSKKKQIIYTIEYYEKNDYYDPVGEALGLKSKDALEKKEEVKDDNSKDDLIVDDPIKEIIVEEEKTPFFKQYTYEILIGLFIVVLVVLEVIKRKPSN